jgi:hypothetical protein
MATNRNPVRRHALLPVSGGRRGEEARREAGGSGPEEIIMVRLLRTCALGMAVALPAGCIDILAEPDDWATAGEFDGVYYETVGGASAAGYDSYYGTDYWVYEEDSAGYWDAGSTWLLDEGWYYDEYTGEWCYYDAYADWWYCDGDEWYDGGWYYDEYTGDWCYYDAYADWWYCDDEYYDDDGYWWP